MLRHRPAQPSEGGRAESSSCLGIRGRNQKKAGLYECQITTGNKLVRFTTLLVTENIPLILFKKYKYKKCPFVKPQGCWSGALGAEVTFSIHSLKSFVRRKVDSRNYQPITA